MGIIDIYYRSFKDLRKLTVENHQCTKDRQEIAEANADDDKLNTTKYLCRIDEEWIAAIEKGLEFVEKAVEEERQFIRANGEVVPIEKVKKISKDSVEHLAKHSEMITHVPEETNNNIVPDKLYMVEKLSDYAVYENRFLYMLLCYLREFIDFRLEKIETLRRTYISDMSVSKKIETKKRVFTLETKIYEKRTDNPYPVADEASVKTVQRIKDCQSLVSALLETDLMQQVAKTPMIKPPIVKTNVLKMNNNFKNALALYDYVAAYKGLGFEYEEIKTDLAPYSDRLADELAEAFHLVSFITYKAGNDLEEILETRYNDEEKRLRDEENRKLAERIKRLKKRALESNKTLEEYMLLLDERNKMLEKDSEELVVIRQEVEHLNSVIGELNLEKKQLNRRVEELDLQVNEKEREIAVLNQKYLEDMTAIKNEHQQAVAQLSAENEQRLNEQQIEFSQKMQAVISEYEVKSQELQAQMASYNAALSDVEARRAQVEAEYQARVNELDNNFKRNCAEQEAKTQKIIQDTKNEMLFVQGQLDSMRIQQGNMTPSTDYSSRERFVELQGEFMAFEKFFKEQWKLTKKEIRKNVLWAKPEKKKKKNAPEEEAPEVEAADIPEADESADVQQ